MNAIQIPIRFETEIIEPEAMYRKAFRYLALLRANPQKLTQACEALSEISSSDTYIEGDEDVSDE
jgi:hypothetical protein